MEGGAFVVPPRLPLGEFYRGECRASSEPHLPATETVTKFCNNGYCRGACDRFPADSPADAVRFHIATSEPGAVRVQFVLEKACWPAGSGFLEYSKTRSRFVSLHPDPIVQRQAEAFLDSFLQRSLV
jgi:hypothetical protein